MKDHETHHLIQDDHHHHHTDDTGPAPGSAPEAETQDATEQHQFATHYSCPRCGQELPGRG